MTTDLTAWAIRNGVSYSALVELRAMFNIDPAPPAAPGLNDRSEAYVQSLVRLEAVRCGAKLWRNNVGVLPDENGRPIRYGLANDSSTLNGRIKSGDLIGWRPIDITTAHIGKRIAQFVSRECKAPNWRYTGTGREAAQLRWAEVLVADGGDACFVTGEGSL